MENVTAVVVNMLPDGRLRPDEDAKYIGVSPKTLAQWRYKKQGPRALRRAGRIFYRLVDLQQWLDIREGDDAVMGK